MLDVNANDVYAQALACARFKGEKATLVFDNQEVYYADSINVVEGNVIITKGGKTITISEDSVTSTGNIQPTSLNLYELSYTREIDDDDTIKDNVRALFLCNKTLTQGQLTQDDLKYLITFNKYNENNDGDIQRPTIYYSLMNNNGITAFRFTTDGDTIESDDITLATLNTYTLTKLI